MIMVRLVIAAVLVIVAVYVATHYGEVTTWLHHFGSAANKHARNA